MDRDPVTVSPETSVEQVVRVLKDNELPGVPVINEGGRCVGIITEADLVIADEEGDLHIPHYIELMGGVVFLEPLRRFEERLRKAVASSAAASRPTATATGRPPPPVPRWPAARSASSSPPRARPANSAPSPCR